VLEKGYDSLNFFLRDSAVPGPGVYDWRVEICGSTDGTLLAGKEVTVPFVRTKGIAVIFVPIRVVYSIAPNTRRVFEAPESAEMTRCVSFLRRIYPVAEEDVVLDIQDPEDYVAETFDTEEGGISIDGLPLLTRLCFSKVDVRLAREQAGYEVFVCGVVGKKVYLGSKGGVAQSLFKTAVEGIEGLVRNGPYVTVRELDLPAIVAHEIGHCLPFMLSDTYRIPWDPVSIRNDLLNGLAFNPLHENLRGTHSGPDGATVLVDDFHSFWGEGVQYGMMVDCFPGGFIREVSAHTLVPLDEDGASFNHGDSYTIFNRSDRQEIDGCSGNFVRFFDGAFNTGYGPSAPGPVYWGSGGDVTDFMGNGGAFAHAGRSTWAEPNAYGRMFAVLADAARDYARGKAARTSCEVVLIGGTLRGDSNASLVPMRSQTMDTDLPLAFGEQYAAVLYDADGADLLRAPFDVDFLVRSLSGDVVQDCAPFLVVAEKPASLHEVRIVRLAAGRTETVLCSVVNPGSVPTVHLLAPNGGGNLAGIQRVNWEAQNAGECALYYSHDGGVTFSLVADGITASCYDLDVDALPGGDQCLVKVAALDGFNQATDVSDTAFTVPAKAPSVAIAAPEDGSVHAADMPVSFEAHGYDPEDGEISGGGLVWTSSLAGELGTGNRMRVVLPEGQQLVSVTATDSTGSSAVATVTVTVGNRQAMPVADAGPDLRVTEGDSVIVDGSASSDPNGDPVIYRWEQIAGPLVSLNTSAVAQLQFVAPAVHWPTTIIFKLTVNDGTADGFPDTVTVSVNPQTRSLPIDLLRGWNLISLPVEPFYPAPASALNSGRIDPVYEGTVWEWFKGDRAATTGGFRRASSVQPKEGVIVYCPEPSSITVVGRVTDSAISLHEGWNLVGPVFESVLPHGSPVLAIWRWNPVNESYEHLSGSDAVTPGLAYWVYSSEDAVITPSTVTRGSVR